MTRLFALAVMLALTACGADGPPQAPGMEPGVSVTGTARIGVVSG